MTNNLNRGPLALRRIYAEMDNGNENDKCPTLHHKTFGRVCAENLPPDVYDRLHAQLRAKIDDLFVSGVAVKGPDERSYGVAVPYLDIDAEETNDPEQRKLAMQEVARVLYQVGRMYFAGFDAATILVLKSPRDRYRIYVANVMYTDYRVIDIWLWLARSHLHDKAHRHYITAGDKRTGREGALDSGPTRQKRMRLHGTDNDDMLGRSVYSVAHRHPASAYDCELPRISVRPTAAQWRRFLRDPEGTLMQLAVQHPSVSVAEPEPLTWPRVRVEYAMFGPVQAREADPFASGDDSSSSDESSDEGDRRQITCAGRHFVAGKSVVECQSCYSRVTQFVVLRTHAVMRMCSSCERLTVERRQTPTEDERLTPLDSSEVVVIGPVVAGPALRPRVPTLACLPLECFIYEPGFGVTKNDAGRLELTTDLYQRRTPRLREFSFETFASRLCELGGDPLSNGDIRVELRQSKRQQENAYFGNHYSVQDAIGATLNNKLNIVALTGGCGIGKTTYAMSVLEELQRRLGPEFYCIAITPREQLCGTLKPKFVTALHSCHLYNGQRSKQVPASECTCISTLESLFDTVTELGAYKRRATVVFVDEVATLFMHLFTSHTLGSQSYTRARALELFFSILAQARYVLVLDRDISHFERLCLSLVAWQCKRIAAGGELQRRIEYRELDVREQLNQTWLQLPDTVAMRKCIEVALARGERVAVFEPSRAHARALAQWFRMATTKVVELQYGPTTPEQKRAFAASPDELLRIKGVDLLVYTSTVGVGISIDSLYFHKVFVVFRSFLPFRDHMQAAHRVRHPLGDGPGQRTLYVVFVDTIRDVSHRLRNVETVGDAVASFARRVVTEDHLLRTYGTMIDTRLNPASVRLEVNAKDPRVVVAAVADRISRLAPQLHPAVLVFNTADRRINVVPLAGYESTKADRKSWRRFVKTDIVALMEAELPLAPDDTLLAGRQKVVNLVAIGFTAAGPEARDADLMTLIEGAGSPQSLARLHALAVDEHCRRMAADNNRTRLFTRAETEPVRQLDSALQSELVIIRAVLAGAGLSAAALIGGGARLISFDEAKAVSGFRGEQTTAGALLTSLFERQDWSIAGRRPDNLRASTKPLAAARMIINAFLGDAVVCPSRPSLGAGAVATQTMQKAFALLWKYAPHHQLQTPQVIVDKSLELWALHWQPTFGY